MPNDLVTAHPHLLAVAFLLLWCIWATGYLEGRFISRTFACVTWALAVVASAIAVVEKYDSGLTGWALALAILLGGTAWIVYYCSFQVRGGDRVVGPHPSKPSHPAP